MKKSVRLSKDVLPVRYAITLKPDLEAFTFSGEEQIRIILKKPVKKITLHSAELEILSAELATGKKSSPAKVSYADKDETATLSFESEIPKGKATLRISFAGILNDKMRGFYRSRYEHNGKTEHMAVTQFESTDARRAFPCFDEPAQKAIFDVSLIIPKDRTAISNTVETEVAEHEGGYKVVKFAPSPQMSSYLVAFIIGHFEHIEKKTKRGVLVRVFCTPGKKHQSAFALECAVKCIEFYEKYFGIRYPLPVMDLIAIPDFAAGAMENWGAVTYRETAVLVDPVHSSTANKQRVALVIAHELAHQWFGNLVTMEWWTHLWLNEGFATYMEYVAIDDVFPQWNIWNHFVYAEHSRALSLDGLANTHAIEIDVGHPSEISEIFDAVSYSKGASVIRMLAGHLGEKAFRAGLQHYLKKHEYGNASTVDLWNAFEKASGRRVAVMMRDWTREPGYPLVSMTETPHGIQLTQQRYFGNGAKSTKTIWSIPLSISSGGTTKKILLDNKKAGVDVKAGALKVNRGETSLVRIRYSAQNLQLLTRAIAKMGDGLPEADPSRSTLAEADRFGIVRDAYALAESGHLHTDEYLRLLPAYKNEDAFIVWGQICEQLHRLNNLYFGTDVAEPFRKFGRSVLQIIVKEIAWKKRKGESEEQALLRSVVLFASGSLGDIRVIQDAQEMFAKVMSGHAALEPDLRGVVYNLVAQNGGKKEFDSLMMLYKKATLEEEKDRLMRALCSFKDPAILQGMLDFAFSKEARGQDTLKAVNFVWSNPYGRNVAWKHLTKHWGAIVERFGGGHLFSRFLLPAASEVSVKRAQEIEKFFHAHPSDGLARTIALATEQIRSNASWLARDKKKAQAFLKSIS